MIEDCSQFLNRVFLYFPPKLVEGVTFESVFEEYYKALNTFKANYELAFSEFMRTYELKSTPNCSFLYKLLDKYRIEAEENKADKGIYYKNISAKVPNGIVYEFAYSGNTGVTLEQAKRNLIKRGFTLVEDKKNEKVYV